MKIEKLNPLLGKLIFFSLVFYMQWANSDPLIIEDKSGKKHTIQFSQNNWVVINYFATWCKPCRKEIPELVTFYDKHKRNNVNVLGVNVENINAERLAIYIDHHMINYPVIQSSSTKETLLEPVVHLPLTYVFSPKGKLVQRIVGIVSHHQLEGIIKDD